MKRERGREQRTAAYISTLSPLTPTPLGSPTSPGDFAISSTFHTFCSAHKMFVVLVVVAATAANC